jgi:colanic acid/amylovoran biosynthesis glycosyltransferase
MQRQKVGQPSLPISGTLPRSQSAHIAYVCQQFPALTQTFTSRQIAGLQKAGLDVVVFSAKPRDPRFKPENGLPPAKRVVYLPPLLSPQMFGMLARAFLRQPSKVAQLLRRLAGAPVSVTRRLHRLRPVADFMRGVSILACVHARYCVGHLHAEFAGSETSIAWVVSHMTGLPFSFTSHTSKYEPLLELKVADAQFVVAISDYERRRLLARCGSQYADKIHVVHLGVDTQLWRPQPPDHKNGKPMILSVGSLFEKKGQDYLIRAVALLMRRGLNLQCLIVGDGPRRPLLEDLTRRLGLSGVVELVGPLPNDKVKSLCQRAAAFALPSVTSRTEGTDGIPVSLMEAMASAKPCISTPIAGIPELLEDNVTGLLVPERDPLSLANGIQRLLSDVDLCRRLGENARRKVEAEFNLCSNIPKLAALFHASLNHTRGNRRVGSSETNACGT